METVIEDFVQSAVQNLFQRHPDLQASFPTEPEDQWNICHHLANELHQQFPWFDCDVKVRSEEQMRPKIILHRRGRSDFNFLEIDPVSPAASFSERENGEKHGESKNGGSTNSYLFGASIRLNDSSDWQIQVRRATG